MAGRIWKLRNNHSADYAARFRTAALCVHGIRVDGSDDDLCQHGIGHGLSLGG